MRTYDTYKDSGISWLGQIPSHWDVRRTKTIWEEHVSLSETGTEQLLSVSQYDGVKPNDEGSRSESLVGYKVVDSNNMVINIMLAWLGGLGVSQYKGIVSPAYCVYKLKENHCPEYFHYLYRTAMYLAEFARKSTGVVPSRWRMYTDSFGTVLSLVPPLAEQEAIVAYLDNATAEIDKAIASQQRMVELLQERKQIIINQAVTQGLNPDAPMKPTNIDWLPQIPAHWQLTRIKNIASVKTGKTPPSDSKEYYENGDILWYTPGDINTDSIYLNDSERKITQKTISDGIISLFPANSVLMVCIGTIGKVGLSKKKCFSNQQINAISVNSKANPAYIAYYFQSKSSYIFSETNTVTLPIINQQSTKQLIVLLPPLTEQKAIVNYIESAIQPIENVIIKCGHMIDLLTERKQILINDVVTGKIKIL